MPRTSKTASAWKSATNRLAWKRKRLIEATEAVRRAEQVEREAWDSYQAELAADATTIE